MLNPTSSRTVRVVVALMVGLGLAAELGGCKAARAVRAARQVQISGLDAGAPAAGALAIHIENTVGEVVVESNPRMKAPSVAAFPLDRRGLRVADAQAWVAAERTVEDGKAVLRVLATDQDVASARPVYVKVRVPVAHGVYVRNAGGPVRLTNVSGPVEVQADGSALTNWKRGAEVSVTMSEPVDAPVSLTSATGPVKLEMPASSRGKLEIQGATRSLDFMAPGVAITDARTKGTTYTATLNGGTNPIVVRSGGKDVVVRARKEDPATK